MVTHHLKILKVNAQTFIILQGIIKLPFCKQCGKTLNDKNFKNIYHGFRDFCCGKCRAKWDIDHWTQERHQRLSNAVKRGYQAMSHKERLQLSKNISSRLHDRTPEQKKHTIDAYKQTCANRTSEEKTIVSKHISDAYHNMSDEQKAIRRKHISDALQNMDESKKQHRNMLIGQKNHSNWLNKTDEEKEAYREARRIGAANRTQETINKMVDACNKTKRQNRSFNKSKPEEDAFQKLTIAFGNSNVIRQYKCDRYPFNCDFYIKSLDIFIECNYFWQHGKHPFNPNCKDDLDIVKKWKFKSNEHNAYERAIYVWTQLDVKKQQIANDNKLFYKAFYSTKEFDEWLKSFTYTGEKYEKTI